MLKIIDTEKMPWQKERKVAAQRKAYRKASKDKVAAQHFHG